LGRPLRIAVDPHANADDTWERVLAAMTGTLQNEVAKACGADEARLNESWALLH
jgi:hypothetical protein